MRERLTRVRVSAKAPAVPGAGDISAHPLGRPDPEVGEYENGSFEQWAEIPTKGPYPNTRPPAVPGADEPQGHPLTDPAHYFPKTAVARAESKAERALRLAKRVLGKKASQQDLESQAYDFMFLPLGKLDSSLSRIASEEDEEEDLLEEASKKAAEGDEGDGEGDTPEKKARRFTRLAAYWKSVANSTRRACMPTDEDVALSEMLAGSEDVDPDDVATAEDEALLAEMLSESEGPTAGDDVDVEAEAMLAEMLAGSEDVDPDDVATAEDEALLAEMLKQAAEEKAEPKAEEKAEPKSEKPKSEEKAKPKAEPKSEEKAKEASAKASDDLMVDDLDSGFGESDGVDDLESLLDGTDMSDETMDITFGTGLDPMMSGDGDVEEDLASLYADRYAGSVKPSNPKTASTKLLPQPKLPGVGPKTIGNGPIRVASDNEIEELQKLWPSAPDISNLL